LKFARVEWRGEYEEKRRVNVREGERERERELKNEFSSMFVEIDENIFVQIKQ
jgi:hypothetical protein